VRRADEKAFAPQPAMTKLAKTVKREPPRLDDADLMARQYALAELVRTADKSWAPEAALRLNMWSVAKQSPIAMHHWRALAASRMAPSNFALFFEDGDPQAIELLDAVGDVAVRMAETRRGALEDDPPRGPFEDLEACGILALARGEKGGSNSLVRAKALRTLGVLARVCEPWDGKWWSIAPAKLTHPARTLDWRGTQPAYAALRQALTDPDDAIRKAALAAVADAADARLLDDIRRRVIDEQVHDLRADAIEALGRLGNEEDGPLFARIARKSPDLQERLSAMRIGSRLAPQAMWQSAFELADRDATPAELQAASLEMLSNVDPATVKDLSTLFTLAVKCSANSSPVVRRASCKLLALTDGERSLPILLALERDSEVHTAAFEALATLADPRAARAFAQGLGDQDPEVRSAARRVIAREKQSLRPALEGMAQRQEFDGAVMRELRGLYAGHQPILEWDVRGPCAVDELRGKLDFSKDHASESLRSLEAIQPKHAVSSREDGMLDLRKLLTDKSNQAAYAFDEFESSMERDVELHVGSDDQVKVWLNGDLVHEFDGARAFAAQADHFKAHLLAGKNSFVLRIGQIGGDWSFALTVPEVGSGPLFESKLPAQPTTAEYAAFANEHPGDPAKGALVLQDLNRTTCLRCHAVAGVGEHIGPDLGGLGARYSKSEIVDSILSPSQRILDGYAAVSVLTKDDQLLFGQIKQDDAKGIVLVDSTGTPVTIARADVAEVRASKLSVMPEGLCNTMTPAEFADLVACLGRH
jgi:putative heme-binding domain-containing protein